MFLDIFCISDFRLLEKLVSKKFEIFNLSFNLSMSFKWKSAFVHKCLRVVDITWDRHLLWDRQNYETVDKTAIQPFWSIFTFWNICVQVKIVNHRASVISLQTRGVKWLFFATLATPGTGQKAPKALKFWGFLRIFVDFSHLQPLEFSFFQSTVRLCFRPIEFEEKSLQHEFRIQPLCSPVRPCSTFRLCSTVRTQTVFPVVFFFYSFFS